MKYEEPNMQIYMIDDRGVICTSGDDAGGIVVDPDSPVPGEGNDSAGFH